MKHSNHSSPIIDTIDIGVQRPESIRIMVVQANTEPEAWEERKGLHFQKEKEKKKAATFVEWVIAQATRLTVDALIFPELSVPEELVPALQSWSEQSGSIVVAGSHYFISKHGGCVARSPVIISGRIYHVEKATPAPEEISPIADEGLTPGKKLYSFRNTTIGDFVVFICSDYLDQSVKQILLASDIDIAFIVAFQRDSAVYHQRINIDVEESDRGLYSVYSNMRCLPYGDGRSCFFGQMDKMYLDKLKTGRLTDLAQSWKICELDADSEYFVVECNLFRKRPFAKRTVGTRPNVSLIEKGSRTDKAAAQFTQRVAQYDQRYSRIEELFVPPSEYGRMLQLLEKKRLLFIVGDPGIGKTYTAARLLKHYFDLGYDPVWYAGLEKTDRLNQRRILENFYPEPRHAVYFEDPFGRTSFERRDSIARIFGPLLDHLGQIDARVIVSSRKEIFDQFTQEAVTAVDLNQFSEVMNVVKPSYSSAALESILKRIAQDASWYSDSECLDAVREAIDLGKLRTPLSIRDFVFSTAQIKVRESLLEHLERRGIEETRLFSLEMEACRIRTKLALALVFLFGTQSLATLSGWYNSVGKFLDPTTDHWSGRAPILGELRHQTGYRIEQYGYRYHGFRFTHPRYEEAFAELIDRDAVVLDVVSSVLKFVARQDLMTAIQGATSHVMKYPRLVADLLNHIVPIIRSQASLTQLSVIGLKLDGNANSTGVRELRLLIEKITGLKDMALRINAEKDLYAIAHALRFVNHYGSALRVTGDLPSQWRREFVELIDFEAISSRLAQEPNFSKLSEALIWLTRFFPRISGQHLASFAEQDLLLRFRTLPVWQRVRLADTVPHDSRPGCKTSSVCELLLKSLESHEKRISRQGLKRWLLEYPVPDVGIVIDDGAAAAIRKEFSLLPVGVVDTLGEFDRNHTVAIFDLENNVVGVAIAAYSSQEIESIKGLHSCLIGTTLGYSHGPSVTRLTTLAPGNRD